MKVNVRNLRSKEEMRLEMREARSEGFVAWTQ